MSKHNSMTSSITDVLSQQQSNLQQLNNLHIRSNSAEQAISDLPPGGLGAPYGAESAAAAGDPQLRKVHTSYSTASANVSGSTSANVSASCNGNSNGNVNGNGNGTGNGNGYGITATPRRIGLVAPATPAASAASAAPVHPKADPSNPLVVLMPASAQPTEVLANRFSAWRNVIKSIIAYLTETASIQDEIVRQQLRLTHAVQFPFFAVDSQQPTSLEEKAVQSFFLPANAGSIQELPTILSNYHGTLASHASRVSKELTHDVIPRLEDLRRDLLVKIKEIKSLQSDFKNSCFKELQQTKIDMKHYVEAIEEAHHGCPKQDPYLAKIALDRQIRKQLAEENFVHEAFDNLESSGAELENVVVMEIQNSLTIYARLLGEESQLVFDVLLSKLDIGFFSKDPQFEWTNFITNDPNFIAPNLPMRRLKEISYKYQYDALSYEIRSGVLERRSKFLKSYSKGYYVLTPSYLHEFKTADRKKDQIPMMSLSLSECSVTEHSKQGSSDDKFVLHAKQNGLIHRGHNWVFRTDSYEAMMAWFQDLKTLTSITSLKEKIKFVSERLNLSPDGRPKQVQLNNSPSVTLPRGSADLRSLYAHTTGSSNAIIASSGEPLQTSYSECNRNSSASRSDNHSYTTRACSMPDPNVLPINDPSSNLYAGSMQNVSHKWSQ
ncbi:SLM1 (YIL105C) and SLM2 (YNL047C) [Zygosaccharomyces parabailii]|nr:SLM1 (YIL105C) and SLM2 (YNL047C) [Zygosaccharomyces parabailii]